MKSLAELKAQLSATEAAFNQQREQDPSLSSKQFSIKFGDGSTLFMQPSKMEKIGNLPVYNPESYLRKHHPEKLQAYLEIRGGNEKQLKQAMDKFDRHKSQYSYDFLNL